MRVVILTAVLLGSCSSASVSGQSEAQFRYIANDVFGSLNKPSCSAPLGFDRNALLRDEVRAIENFRREIAGTRASQLLSLAQQDATYEQNVENRCWADDDIQVAEKHVEMTKKRLRIGLPKLRELFRKLQGTEIENITEPRDFASFRYFTKRLIESSRPMCPIASEGRDNEIMSAPRKQITQFRRALSEPFVRQFDIAEADVIYVQSLTQVECADPSEESTDKLASQALDSVKDQLASVRKSMN